MACSEHFHVENITNCHEEILTLHIMSYNVSFFSTAGALVVKGLSTYPVNPTFFSEAPSTHSNCVLIFSNNVYRHISSAKQFEYSANSVNNVSSVKRCATSIFFKRSNHISICMWPNTQLWKQCKQCMQCM